MDLRRPVGLRRIKALIHGLPGDSALGRELVEEAEAAPTAPGRSEPAEDGERFHGFGGLLRAVKG